jgi:uncharacterized protein YabN with tetrapyrrole methylase and pyrophosphatase domain
MNKSLSSFVSIMQKLKTEDDFHRDHTPKTIIFKLQEEVQELIEAIEKDDITNIMEELGDVLFFIVFMSNYYNSEQLFSIEDVINGISTKMIVRHPNAFKE